MRIAVALRARSDADAARALARTGGQLPWQARLTHATQAYNAGLRTAAAAFFAQGLYGGYLLVIKPRDGLPVELIDDVELRFDYLAVARPPVTADDLTRP